MFLLARVSLHHRLVKYSNIRGQIADSTRQTYGHVWFDKSTIRHRIFEYSDSTESKCPSLPFDLLVLMVRAPSEFAMTLSRRTPFVGFPGRTHAKEVWSVL